MVSRTTVRWGILERWTKRAFVTAGVLLLGTAVLFGLTSFTGVDLPAWWTGLSGVVALLAAFAGLAALYPGLADRSPRLARAALGSVTVGAIAIVAFPLCQLAETSGIGLPAPPVVLLLVFMGATVLGFLLFGVACLRTGVYSNAVGVLLVAIVSSFLVLFAGDLAFGGSPAWLNFAANGVQAVFLLAIGRVLPTYPHPGEREETQVEAVSG